MFLYRRSPLFPRVWCVIEGTIAHSLKNRLYHLWTSHLDMTFDVSCFLHYLFHFYRCLTTVDTYFYGGALFRVSADVAFSGV